jgi:hypothetical protein
MMKRSRSGKWRSINRVVTSSFVSPPQEHGDGTYWIEAGETCGGLCGQGGTYVLEEKDGTWASTGAAPGTGMWVS